MIPEDTFSRTVADAAAYESYRSRGDYDDDDDGGYTRADAASDAHSEVVHQFLDPLVDAEILIVEQLADEIAESGIDQPHPWTWHRHLLAMYEESEDAMREELEEHFEEEAENAAVNYEYDNQPCCRSRDCPCGGY